MIKDILTICNVTNVVIYLSFTVGYIKQNNQLHA